MSISPIYETNGLIDETVLWSMIGIRNDKALKKIGERIRALRLDANLSQYKLADASDIPRSQIIRIENGEVNATISSIIAVSRGLNIHPKELLDFKIPII